MQEIEIKFEIDDYQKVIQQIIDKNCTFDEPLYQKDTIFRRRGKSLRLSEGEIVIRIREENGSSLITLKQQSKDQFSSKEIEFKVESYDKAYDFLETLGFKEIVTVEKTRRTTKYKQFNICIDQVNHLGEFIEIEIITTDNKHVKDIEREILALARELNINPRRRVRSFYDTMMMEKEMKEEAKHARKRRRTR